MTVSIQTIIQSALPPGPSGYSGISGYSGYSGISGYSGYSGISGYSGYSGISGYSGLGYAGLSSTTSTTIGTGSKTFTVNQDTSTNAFKAGDRVRIANTTPTNFMEGVITAYTTTSLTVSVDTTSGSGTLASWTIGIAGQSGISGVSGFSGFSGISGFSGFSGISGFSGYSGISGFSGYSGLDYAGLTSTTSTTIGTGSKTFTVNQNTAVNAYTVGNRVRVASSATPANWMEGLITAYTTTSLTVNVDLTGGSGTIASWNIGITGEDGVSGYSGYSGSGVSGFSGYSGISGFSGYSGVSGYSGASGVLANGTYAISTTASVTGTTSTTGVMAGLSDSFTPTGNGDFIVVIEGYMTNATNGGGGQVQIRYGTGTAPTNGAALTGTAVGLAQRYVPTTNGTITAPFSVTALITGTTPGVAVWLDLSQAAVTSGTATLSNIVTTTFEVGVGQSGRSGFSGYSGISGFSGYSGISGASGISGFSGYSGASGISGFSGYSGASGISGFSGYSGISGASGISGFSGYSGRSGFSGYSGISGFSGYSGPSGFSGYSSASGFSGYSGISGFSGYSGASGISGFSGYSGSGISGFSGYSGASGISGFSGYSGASGRSGYSGYSSASGFSGYSGISGYSGYSGIAGPATVINATDDNATTALYPVMVAAAGTNQTPKVDTSTTPFVYNASAGSLTMTGTMTAATAQVTTLTTGANTTAGTITGTWTLSAGSTMNATYADLAENYAADGEYPPGTVLVFGGSLEVTLADSYDSTRVAGVVSTDPAYVMNSECDAVHVATIALQGRVPAKVLGPVAKGDLMVTGPNGYAVANNMARAGTIIGKSLEDFADATGTIEIVVGRV